MRVPFYSMQPKRILIGVLALLCCAMVDTALADGLATQLWPPKQLTRAVAAGARTWGSQGDRLRPTAIDCHPSGFLIGIDGARHRIFIDHGPARPHTLAERGRGFPARIFARAGLQFYALDPGERAIDVFDLQGLWETRFNLEAAAQEVPLEAVTDLCLDSAGDLYILDGGAGRIHVFNDAGNWQRLLEAWGDWACEEPLALEVDGRGQLHLLESRPPAILTLDADGRLIQRRSLRDEAGAAFAPVALATDPWGNLFVGARESGRVQVLPADDSAAWWIAGEEAMQIADLATDGEGKLFVADPRRACVWVFDLTYQAAKRSGERGRRP